LHVYEIRPHKDHRGVDLISDVLPFGRVRLHRIAFSRADDCRVAGRAIESRTEMIDPLYRIATPPTRDMEIEIIETKLLNLAIDGDEEAARQYANMFLSRLDWERIRSAEHQQQFVDQAQNAQAWLAVNFF